MSSLFGFDWAAGYVSPFRDSDGTPYVTPPAVATALVDVVAASSSAAQPQLLIDLGSGDGRLVLAAAERGLRAHGVELDPNLVAESRVAAVAAGVAENATFEASSLLDAELPAHADLVAYLLPAALKKLARRLVGHRGRLFVVRWSNVDMPELELAHSHALADGWCAALDLP
jgi:SAM-dependent methyltransferase